MQSDMPTSSKTELAIRVRGEFIKLIHHPASTLSESEVPPDSTQFHLGLLILRMTAFIVLLTWGWPTLHDLLSTTVFAEKPLRNSELLTLVSKLGLPFPTFLGVCAILNESIGMAAVSVGLLARVAALIATLEMAGVLYASAQLERDLLAAFLCLVVFASIAILGPGRYSIDHFLSRHFKVRILSRYMQVRHKLTDAGLLLLRIGVAVAMIGAIVWSNLRLTNIPATILFYTLAYCSIVGGFFVTLGLWTRISCGLLSLLCVVAILISEIGWYSFGARALLLTFVFASLALMGAGRRSVDALRWKFDVATNHE